MAPGCRDARFGENFDERSRITDSNDVQFKFRLTLIMAADFAGCWIIEVFSKYFFADLEPKEMITRGRDRREKRRLLEQAEVAKSLESKKSE
jgi:hypothetical protein